MSAWVNATKEMPDVETKVFVSDRIVTTTLQSPDETLAATSVKSGEVGAVLGLERHPDKRKAASSSRKGRRLLRKEAGLGILGVLHSLPTVAAGVAAAVDFEADAGLDDVFGGRNKSCTT